MSSVSVPPSPFLPPTPLGFPQWLGVPWGHQDHYAIVPLADLGIRLPTVLLGAFFASALLLDVLLLRHKRWTRPLRRVELTVGVLAAVALARMVLTAGPHHVNEAWQVWQTVRRAWRLKSSA